MKKTIALIGTGKFAKALILGFLATGTPIESLIVIGRAESKDSDLDFFKNLNVQTSREIQDAHGVETIIIAVKPEGVGPQLTRLKKIKLQQPHKNEKEQYVVPQKIICLASGTNIDMCSKYLDIHPAIFVKGTGTVNVEYGTGIICLAGIHNGINSFGPDVIKHAIEIFSPFSKVIRESSHDVLKAIVTVGTWTAFDTRMLALVGEKETKEKNISFNEWLLSANENHPLIAKYLQNKADVFVHEMGYSKTTAQKRSLETLQSTISTLLLIPEIDGVKLQKHIDKVATKGGCTEKGLNMLTNIEVMLSFTELCKATKPVYRRTTRFVRDAEKSFEKK